MSLFGQSSHASWNNVEVASELLGLTGWGCTGPAGLNHEVADLISQTSRYVMFWKIRCRHCNYVFDIYCLDDADESNEESESRVTSRLRWNCRAALGTGMRRSYLGDATAAGEGGDDEDEDDDDSTTKASGNDYPDEETLVRG
jgi:hypothetical protein